MARLSKIFSFKSWAASRPSSPLPGDKVDDEFAEVRKVVNAIDVELKDVRRSDGKLVDGIVTKASLAPDIAADLTQSVQTQIASSVASVQAAAGQASLDAQNAAASAAAAAVDAANASTSAQSVLVNAPGAIKTITDAQAAASQTFYDAVSIAAQVNNDASSAHGDAGKASLYADLSELWAEYMGLPDGSPSGDQKIPPNKLALMGVTGDHWSSRWWANRASNAFGKLTELYLGVHPDHATATASSTQKPPAAGAIYYNSSDNRPYLWTGSGWQPFWSPQKALQTSLFYKVTAAQTDFVLSTSDLFSNSFTLDKTDTEPLEVFVNGVRLFPGQAAKPASASGPAVPAVAGDYTVDATNNKVVISQALAVGSVVSIDVLTPRDKFAVGSVNFHALLNLDLDPTTKAPGQLDGVKKQFVLTRVDGKPVTAGGAEEVFVSVDGVIQQAGIDYNLAGARLTFTEAPSADAKVWALWMEPGGSGGGKGVNPPPPPEDLHSNHLGWLPGTGTIWDDNRGEMHSVANAAARLALRDPEQLIPGSMVYERDTHDIWVYTPAGVAGTGAAPVAGTGATGTGGTTVRQDVNLLPGSDFPTAIRALSIGDTVFVGGKYYRLARPNAMREIEFPGGTSYNAAIFMGSWSDVPGPAWNNYLAPATPGMANPAGTTVTGSTSSAPTAAGDPKLTTNWTMALKGHPTDNILRALEYDPSKPNSMAWEDNRDEMETVNALADLNNRTILPASHLTVGKLVYVRATGELWECMVDGTTGTITNTNTDWKQLGGGLKYVGRAGNLPAGGLPDGALYIIANAANGNPAYNRLVAWDAINSAWVYPTTRNYMHATSADPQDAGDVDGDLQITYENGHALLEAWDVANTAWHTIYSEDTVKQWIAASNLFQGTVEDRGHGTVGAIDLNVMKAQSALGVTDAGHYWIYVGLAGHVVTPNEIGGSASNIDGAKLNVGDWLLVANTGTAAAPVMKYTHIPGDLLAKSRGDGLYGLNAYAPGAYEIGSLVVSGGDIYKASRAVLLADPAPGATGAPWVKVDISGGVKTVAADSNLPPAAPNGAVYLVLSSAQAGGKGALYMRDNPSSKWQPLGGGGVPLALGGGKKLQNVGVPIGTILMFGGTTAPAGYKLCDGSTFDQTVYPELYAVLGVNRVPDFHDMFPRGWSGTRDNAWTRHTATTGMPTTHFTGVTNSTGSHTHTTDSQGEHRHNVGFSMSNHNWKGGGSWTGDATCNFSQDGGAASSSAGGHTHTTTSAGAHTHTVEINSGGDAETAPVHVRVPFIIKCDDIDIRKHA